MRISLYRFNGKSNVANKVDNLQALYSADITPYGAFDSTNVVFKLDRMLDANICKYEFNNHAYYGTCEVNVDTDDVYVYNVKSDSLTTAWYNDCMNVNVLCQYSMSGDKLKYDERIVCRDYVNNYYIDISTPQGEPYTELDLYVIMAVKRTGVAGNMYVKNPNFDLWLFKASEFNKFITILYNAPDRIEAKYAGSIYNLFLLHKKNVPFNLFTQTGNVVLYATMGETDFMASQSQEIYGDYTAYYCFTDSWFNDYSKHVSKNINFPLNEYARQNAQFLLHIENVGDISFRYRDVMKNQSITSVGYRLAFDFITGTQIAYLTINGEVRKEFSIRAPIQMSCALSYDSSIVRWDRVNSQVMGAAVNVGATIANAVINPASLITGIPSMAQTAINTGQAIADANFEKNYGARSTVGSVGNSPEFVTSYGSYLNIKVPVPIDAQGYQNLFGYPDGNTRNVKSLKGFVKTSFCKLTENGLPRRIVDEAERACDAGFYII